MNQTVGIIGGGFVGHATARAFMEFAAVRVFDVDARKANASKAEALECDFVFVCLPTPMADDGQCDLSYVEEFFCEQRGSQATFVIKSTVPVGTTDDLCRKYDLPNLVFSPEFLTARCAVADAMTPSRLIVGCPEYCGAGTTSSPAVLQARIVGAPGVEDLLRTRYRQGVQVMPARAAELVKYGCNAFFAVKVAYFNELRQIADACDCDYETVLTGILADGRIANAHVNVPGPDGNFGFGGTCLPKDLNALIHTAKENGTISEVLEAAWRTNCEVRPIHPPSECCRTREGCGCQ